MIIFSPALQITDPPVAKYQPALVRTSTTSPILTVTTKDYYMFSRGFRTEPSSCHWHPGRGVTHNLWFSTNDPSTQRLIRTAIVRGLVAKWEDHCTLPETNSEFTSENFCIYLEDEFTLGGIRGMTYFQSQDGILEIWN